MIDVFKLVVYKTVLKPILVQRQKLDKVQTEMLKGLEKNMFLRQWKRMGRSTGDMTPKGFSLVKSKSRPLEDGRNMKQILSEKKNLGKTQLRAWWLDKEI